MSDESIGRLLRSAAGRCRRTAAAAAGLFGLTALAVTLLVVVVVDASFGLPPAGLVLLDLLLAGVLAWGLMRVGMAVWRHRYRPRWVARLIEERAGVTDNRLINAVDLQQADAQTTGASEALRDRVIQRGRALAATLNPSVAVERTGLWRACRFAGASGAVLLLLALLAPGLFRAVVPRLVDPYGGHPPFTFLEFDVAVEPDTVYYGQPASVRARITGPGLPEQASIVFVEADAGRRVLPMMRRGSNDRGPQRMAAGMSSIGSGQSEDASPREAARFEMHIDRAERSRRFYVQTDAGRSRVYQLDVHPVPLFEGVQVRHEYPAYTGWAETTEPLPDRGIRVLTGTLIHFDVASNVPLSRGVVTLPDGGSTTLRPADDPTHVVGPVTVRQSGEYTLELIGADGAAGDRALTVSIQAVPDEAPDVYFTEPEPRVVAPEGWKVRAELVATDDIGVDRITLHRGVNGWGPTPTDLPLTRPSTNRATASTEFDLAALGAQAGDVIKYHAVAYDNHPEPANYAETNAYTIEVIRWEAYVEYMRRRVDVNDIQEQLDDLLEQLADLKQRREALLEELEALQAKIDAGEPLTDAEQRRLDALEEKLAEYARDAAALAEAMRERTEQPELYEFESAINARLREMAAGLDQQAEAAGNLGNGMAEHQPGESGSTAPLKGLSPPITRFAETDAPWGEEQQAEREQLEADMQTVAAANAMVAQAEQLRHLIQAQRDLADRLAVFRHKEDLSEAEQLRAAKMAGEQAELREQLDRTTERLRELAAEHADRLPKMSGSAEALVKRLDELKVQRDQQTAERLAGAGRGRHAHASAETAAVKLESLLSDCQAMPGQAEGDLDGCLSLPRESWANSMAQMMAGMSPTLGTGQSGNGGAGYYGSMASMSIAGPRNTSTGDSAASAPGRAGRHGGEQRADATADAERLDPDETLQTENHLERDATGGTLPGVPTRWRDEAEAYFRRLADESR